MVAFLLFPAQSARGDVERFCGACLVRVVPEVLVLGVVPDLSRNTCQTHSGEKDRETQERKCAAEMQP